LRLTYVFPSQAQAKAAATGALANCRRATGEMTASFPGVPALIAGGTVQLINVHPELQVLWYVRKVVHAFGVDGYSTSIEGDRLTSDVNAEEVKGFI